MRRRLVIPRTIWSKKGCTCTTHRWSHVHYHLAKFIIRWESLIFSVIWVVCCCKAMNSWDWVLDTDWELPTVKILQVAHKFSVVMLERLYTWFLSGPPDDPASIHKSGSKYGWVERSSPYLSLNQLLYVSWKLKNLSSNSIQENSNLRKKMVERTYHEVLSAIVDELLHPLLAVFSSHVRLHKKLIGLGSRSRDVACKKKNVAS